MHGPHDSADLHMAAASRELLTTAVDIVERHRDDVTRLPVSVDVSPTEVRDALGRYDFSAPHDARRVLEHVTDLLTKWTVHTTHPRYFGLFNPSPALMGIVGDTLAAAFNPQLAAWSHAPAANEIERHVLGFVGERAGYAKERVAGSFTTGGAEANLTAVLLALTKTAPQVGEAGVRALPGDPVFYASQESHLAWVKIAHVCGLGRGAVRLVPVDDDLRMDVGALAAMVEDDRRRGAIPFMVAATAGTTGVGAIDPLPEIAALCASEDMGFHVDAAWGGAVVLSDALRTHVRGMEQADSITLDAHKWLSAPMGAGMFLCQDADRLNEVFRITTRYMPATVAETADPYTSSIQWSRRFIGLKVFLTLATLGRRGHEAQIERDCSLGRELRDGLRRDGWRIENDTPLPLVCFTDPTVAATRADDVTRAVVEEVVASGQAWVSTVGVRGRTAIRACITSHRTTTEDVGALRDALASARSRNR